MTRDSRTVLTRPALPPDLTVAYGDHPDQVVDVRFPWSAASQTSAQPLPGGRVALVVLLHGGFWRQEYDRTHTGPFACALAADGFVVATPEYRRTGSPSGGWPTTGDDVAAAVAAAPDLVATHARVEVTAIVIAGHSAGGQLALWAAAGLARASAGGQARTGPALGVVALAPVADLAEAYRLDLDGGAVLALLGGAPHEVAQRYAAADPMALLPIGVPMVVVHGDRDAQVPVELSRRFAEAAGLAGDAIIFRELPGMDHFDVIDPASPAWPAVCDAVRCMAGLLGSR